MTSTARLAACLLLAVFAGFGIHGVTTGWASSRGAHADDPLPLAKTGYVLGDEIDAYARFMMSGGPPPDGIPSIDRPAFVSAAKARLDGGEPVIGIHLDGEARAYPHRIMVHHEIVNDTVGGLDVAITYCPLTATAQGFRRGGTTLGVSGQLLNSNLVMFDRASRSFFSQINATGLTGPHRGRTLDEIRLVWTTWEHWRAVHPNTQVLSERTGHLRNYARDPYGSYNPLRGYYAQDRTIFPLMHESRRHGTKTMVVGARTTTRSVFFVMSDLARDRVQATASFLAVYDPRLDTGYIYVRDEDAALPVARDDGQYEYQGSLYGADALPLTQPVAVEAFHFAWHAFYPRSETP
jgi:hypothetical protein